MKQASLTHLRIYMQRPWEMSLKADFFIGELFVEKGSFYIDQIFQPIISMIGLFFAEPEFTSSGRINSGIIMEVCKLLMDQGKFLTQEIKYLTAWSLMVSASFPLEMVRTRVQTTPQLIRQGRLSSDYKGIFHCIKEIARKEGFGAFWKGNFANLLRIIPHEFLSFSIKQMIRVGAKKHGLAKKQSVILNFTSSSLASCIALSMIYPFEFARTQLNNDIKGKGSIVKFIASTFKKEGFQGIYKGSVNFFITSAIFRSLYYGGYDTVKQNCPDTPIYRLGGSYLSAMIAIYSVYSFDTIRKRMMMNTEKYDNSWDCFKKIYAKEGLKGCYKGWELSLGQGVMAMLSVIFLDSIISDLKKTVFKIEEY